MNISTIKYFSTVNGDGFRTAVFVSGCKLHCKGCFNYEAWDFNHGVKLIDEIIDKILKSIEPEYIRGLSILGGEPLDENNVEGVKHLINKFREKFGNTKTVWIWSGYTFEELIKHKEKKDILNNCDVLVDGPFKIDLYDAKLAFRGSSNQRIIDLKHSTSSKPKTLDID